MTTNKKNKKLFFFLFIILLLILVLVLFWFIFHKKENLSLPKNFSKNLPKHLIPVPFNRETTDTTLKKIATQIIGTQNTPIYIIDNFLSPQECQAVIESAKGKLVPSPLTRQDPTDPEFRTSETCYFDGTGIQNAIEQKIINQINLPKSNTEDSQIQHYRKGNEFKAHFDYFDPDVDGEFLKQGQRTFTFMVYLNDVEKGGQTNFVKLNQTVYPKQGTAVVWCNIKEDGTPDDMTMHQGSPVENGEKWIITKWFLQDNPYK